MKEAYMDLLATILHLVTTTALIPDGQTQPSCLAFEYSREINWRLQCGIFNTLAVDWMKCQKECTATLNCFSINTYQSDNGTEICELIRGSKESFTQDYSCFVMQTGSEHHELKKIKLCSTPTQCSKGPSSRKVLSDDWYQFDSSAFKHFKTKKTWKDANDTCSANKASLATIDSELENSFITELFLKTIQVPVNVNLGFPPLNYWKLDGTDKEVILHGEAYYNPIKAALVLPGTTGSYATTPALPIQSTSFSISMWVKPKDIDTTFQLYSYWGNPYIFQVGLKKGQIMTAIRKKTISSSWIDLRGGNYQPKLWTHITSTWDRTSKTLTIYQDGNAVASKMTPDADIDLPESIRPVFDLGRKYDSKEVAKVFVRQLVVFNRALTIGDVKRLKDQTDMKMTLRAWIGQPTGQFNKWISSINHGFGCPATAKAKGHFYWDKLDCSLNAEFVCKKSVL